MPGKRVWFTLTSALLAAATGGEALAQESGDEIIITAQKRDQALQDVPISVNVLTAEDIERAQITNIQDLKFQVPSLHLAQHGGRGEVGYLFIRGLGNNTATSTLRAATIVDDVPGTDFASLNNNLFDVEQIEVLRGPQSTLYGLTAEAGLIVVKSRKPGNEFSGALSATYNSLGDYGVNGRMDVPIAPGVFAVSLSAMYDFKDGFIENQLLNDDYDTGESTAYRVRALFTPTQSLSFDFIYSHDEIDDDYGQAFVPLDRAAYVTRHNNPAAVASSRVPYTALRPLGDFEIAADYRGYNRASSDNYSLRGEWDWGGASLVSVTAYRDYSLERSFDVGVQPGGALGGLVQSGDQALSTIETFYQELRLVSGNSDKFRWLLGAAYQTRDTAIPAITITLTSLGGGARVPFGDGGTGEFKSTSAFGQVEFIPNDKFEFQLGARYEETESVSRNTGGFFGFPAPSAFEAADNGLRVMQKSEAFLPKATLSFIPNDDVRFYVTAGRGWLPGSADADPEPGDDGILNAEESWTYEAGLKVVAVDGRLRLNAAVYRTDIEQYQETLNVGPVNQILQNVPKARFQGVEAEATIRFTDRVTFFAGGALTDTEYLEFVENLGAGPVDRAGNRLAAVPDANFNIALNVDVTPRIYVRGELQGAGVFAERQDRTAGRGTSVGPIPVQPALGLFGSHEVFNLKAGYSGDRWSALFFVNNVFNERYFSLVSNTFALNGPGDVYLLGVPGRPLEAGARLSVKF
jgi:iron complex outermembrane recepter protein